MCIGLALGAICCAGATVCNCACSCCKSVCGTTFKQQVRLAYIIITLICFLISIFALYSAKEMFSWFNDLFKSHIHCPDASGGEYNCFGVSSLYRMSFTLMCMYLMIIIMLFTRGECAKAFNEGLWSAKLLFIIIMYVCAFFIPNSFFKGYVVFSQIFGAIFMIFQSIMIIDILYYLGQGMVAQYHAGRENYKYGLFGVAIFFYAGVITLITLNFVWFHDGLNLWINIINTIAVIVSTVIQLLGFNKYGSIITTGGISLYMTFLNFTAMLSTENSDGQTLIGYTGAYIFSLTTGIILIIVVLFYMTFANKAQNADRMKVGASDGLGNAVLLEENDEDYEDLDEEERAERKKKQQENVQQLVQQEIQKHDIEKKIEEEEIAAYQNNQYIIFHIVMFTTSVYSCMLITNWADPDFSDQGNWDWDTMRASDSSYWCKVISAWATCILYIWTLIAPAIFPDRDFS